MLQFSLVPSMCVRLLFILFLIIANNRSYGQSDAWVIHPDTFSYGEGFEFLAPIKLLEENNAIKYFVDANQAYRDGNLKVALNLADKSLKEDASSIDTYILKAWILTESMRYDEALLNAEKAYNISPTDWRSSYCRAFCKFAKSDFLGATVDYSNAIAINNTIFQAYEGRAAAKMQLKDYQSAKEDYDYAIMLKPTYIKAYYGRAITQYHLGNFETAINDFNSVIVKEPENAYAYYFRALCKKNLNQISSSCMDMQKAASLGVEDAKQEMKNYCFRY